MTKHYYYAYSETKDGLQTLHLVVPGKKKEDFKIETSENKLVVSFSDTIKTFKLTDFVDQKKISATYEAGILSIELPMKDKHKPREIKVS